MNPPATLNIAADPASITLGESATITWSSNANTCTASGAWTGNKPSDGSEVVTPDATGDFTYSLVCQGGGYRASERGSATLTVVPARVAAVFMGDACCDRGVSFRVAGMTGERGDFRFIALGTQFVGGAKGATMAFESPEASLAGGRLQGARAFRLLDVTPGVAARSQIALTDGVSKPRPAAISVPADRSARGGMPQGTFTTFLANGYTLTVTIDAHGELNGSDTNGCLLQGRVSARPGARVVDVTHAVMGCGARDGRYAGLAAAVVDPAGGMPGLLLATSNADSAIGWRLSR
jgi:hypothetical protein